MKCKYCGQQMRCDDVDDNFKGYRDNYYVCDNCGSSCIEEIRFGKQHKVKHKKPVEGVQEKFDREKPYRMNYEGDGYDPDGNLVYDTAICKCGREFEIEYEEHYNYCPTCGQRLDWSECEDV